MSDDGVRILVVDDTVSYRKIVSDVLTGVPGINVVGTAQNGRIALRKIEELRPDMMTLDLNMPEMDGLEVLRHLKASGSRVGCIVLSSQTSEDANASINALALGALDFVVKPSGQTMEASAAQLRKDLVSRIQAFSRTRQVKNILSGRGAALAPPPPPRVPPRSPLTDDTLQRLRSIASRKTGRPQIVAIGISTGGPQALTAMMPKLPGNLGVPVVIVQHMPPVFTKSLADSLNQRCQLRVCEGAEGQPLQPGHVYIAPGGRQMKIIRENGTPVLRLTDDPPENSCRPSVDYLFRSVVEIYGGNSVGVIMTGMGNDGAAGCRLMRLQGATIIAQDEASCVVYGMPRQPVEEGVAEVVAPLERIAEEIVHAVKEGAFACK